MSRPAPAAQPSAPPPAAHPRALRIPGVAVIAAAAAVTGLAWTAGRAAGIDYVVLTPIGAAPGGCI